MKERTELIETLSLIVRPENAAKMADAFAHALAEKIRTSARATGYRFTPSHEKGRLYAANEIDPEVKP